MKRTHKPVRKCHACGLNFGDHCGAFEYPHDMWRNGKCPGFQNEALLQKYLAEQARKQVDAAREKRQQTMRLRHTEPHYQGVSPPLARTH
ncbi:MAG: hypothetical protein AB1696_25710 [Planctomycetota bacterium]